MSAISDPAGDPTPSETARPDGPACPVPQSSDLHPALAEVLLGYTKGFEAKQPLILESDDAEALHDYRVAMRKIRSLIDAFATDLPHEEAEWASSAFAYVGTLTGPVRDLDIMLGRLEQLETRLPSNLRAGVVVVAEDLIEERTAARERLRDSLSSEAYGQSLMRWHRFIDQLAKGTHERPRVPLNPAIAARVSKARDRVLKAGQKIADDSPAEALHTLRKRCKRLRYLLEAFGDRVVPERTAKKQVRRLKRLQDGLGSFQDLAIQNECIRQAADRLGRRSDTTTGLLAAGALIALLTQEQSGLRTTLIGRYKRFAKAGAKGWAKWAAVAPRHTD